MNKRARKEIKIIKENQTTADTWSKRWSLLTNNKNQFKENNEKEKTRARIYGAAGKYGSARNSLNLAGKIDLTGK